MDLSFIVGLLSGVGLVLYGIVTNGSSMSQVLASFIDMPSVYITCGGTFAAIVMSVPFKDLKDSTKHLKVICRKEKNNLNEYIDVLVELAKEARLKGLLALEEKINEMDMKDDFLKFCVMLIVDALEPAKVRIQIENEINCIEARHAASYRIYDKGASLAPAFGMLGTLIGLINMLANMSGDPETLGKGMSTALVTTFYGSLLANLFFSPMGNRLKAKHEEEMVVKELIMEGVLSIQAGENPKYIKEKLKSYLSYVNREDPAAAEVDADGNEIKPAKKGGRGRKKKEKAE